MMTSSNGNIFAKLALCAGNSPVPVNSPHKGQWHGALMFFFICAWINGWVDNRGAGDLRRHRGHYDVTVMSFLETQQSFQLVPTNPWKSGGYCYVIHQEQSGSRSFAWQAALYFKLGAFCALQWRHNGRDGVSNNQPHDCSFNRFFRRRSKKT